MKHCTNIPLLHMLLDNSSFPRQPFPALTILSSVFLNLHFSIFFSTIHLLTVCEQVLKCWHKFYEMSHTSNVTRRVCLKRYSDAINLWPLTNKNMTSKTFFNLIFKTDLRLLHAMQEPCSIYQHWQFRKCEKKHVIRVFQITMEYRNFILQKWYSTCHKSRI